MCWAVRVRIESSVKAISWIPSEAIEGLPKVPFELGIGHYDEPPPDHLREGDLERLRDSDRFREANDLRAWIEVEDGRVVDHGYEGGGLVGSTTFRVGPKEVIVAGAAFDTLQSAPEVQDQTVRFVQTVGGRAGFPAPRRVRGKPFFRINSATAWTTLALTIRADGSSDHELVGASPFPRHWIYDRDGTLVHKAGTVDFKTWYRQAHGKHTPWGDEESQAFVTEAESALERQLSRELMQRGGCRPDGGSREATRSSSRASRATSCICCSTECWRSRWTARRSLRSGRARSSASAPCSREAGEPRPCGPGRAAASGSSRRSTSTARCWSSSAPDAGARTDAPPAGRD